MADDPLDHVLGPAEADPLDPILGVSQASPAPQHYSIARGMTEAGLAGLTAHTSDWVRGALGSGNTSENIAALRAARSQFHEEHPWLSTLAELGGAGASLAVPIGDIAQALRLGNEAVAAARGLDAVTGSANLARAAQPGAQAASIAGKQLPAWWGSAFNQAGIGGAKWGALNAAAGVEPAKSPTGSDAIDPVATAGRMAKAAADPATVALNYGLGGAGGVAGNWIGNQLANRANGALEAGRQAISHGSQAEAGGARMVADDLTRDAGGTQSALDAIKNVRDTLTDTGGSLAHLSSEQRANALSIYADHLDSGLSPLEARQAAARDIHAQGLWTTAKGTPFQSPTPISANLGRLIEGYEKNTQFPSMLTEDLAGPNGAGVRRGSQNATWDWLQNKQGSEAAAQSRGWVEQRQADQPQRLQDLYEKVFEGDADPATHVARIEAVKQSSGALFKQGKGSQALATPEQLEAVRAGLQDTIDKYKVIAATHEMPGAAVQTGVADGIDKAAQLFVGEDGKALPMSLDQYQKRRAALWQQIEGEKLPAQFPGAKPKYTELGRELNGLYHDLNHEVYKAYPDWALANKTFSDTSKYDKALQLGYQLPRDNSPAQAKLLDQIKGMSKEEQDLVRKGFLAREVNKIRNTPPTGDITGIMSRRGQQDMLHKMIGPDADEILHHVDRIGMAHTSFKSVLNSNTSRNLMRERDKGVFAKLGNTLHNGLDFLNLPHKIGEAMDETLLHGRNEAAMQMMGAHTGKPNEYFDALDRLEKTLRLQQSSIVTPQAVRAAGRPAGAAAFEMLNEDKP